MDWLHGEPALEEALADPVVRAVMACDGVKRDTVRQLIRDMRRVRHLILPRPGVTRPPIAAERRRRVVV